MHCINICYKVPEKRAHDIEKTLNDHAKFMKFTYVDGSKAVSPVHTSFTRAAELSDPVYP